MYRGRGFPPKIEVNVKEDRSLVKVEVVYDGGSIYTLTFPGGVHTFQGSVEDFAKFLRKVQASDDREDPRSNRSMTYMNMAQEITNGTDTTIWLWSNILNKFKGIPIFMNNSIENKNSNLKEFTRGKNWDMMRIIENGLGLEPALTAITSVFSSDDAMYYFNEIMKDYKIDNPVKKIRRPADKFDMLDHIVDEIGLRETYQGLVNYMTDRQAEDYLSYVIRTWDLHEKITINKGKEMQEAKKEYEFKNANLYITGVGYDTNGNWTVKLNFPNGRGFSIQTNGVLPITNGIRNMNDILMLSDDKLFEIESEIIDYIQNYGSSKQKNGLIVYKSFKQKESVVKEEIYTVKEDTFIHPNIVLEKGEKIKVYEAEKWSGDVKTKWKPPEDLFKSGSADKIAKAAMSGHGGDKGKAVQALNFYINRAGKNLDADRKKVVQTAISSLQKKECFMKKIRESKEGFVFEAEIYIDVFEDDYDQGQGDLVNSYTLHKVSSPTLKGLLKEIEKETGVDSKDIEYGNHNDYEWAGELWASQMVDENNYTVDRSDMEMWKNGQKTLYSAQYQILVSKVGKSQVSEDEFRRAGIKGGY